MVAYAYSLVNERDSCRDYLALAYQRIGSRVDEARVRYDHYRILNHLGDHQGAMENLEAAVFTQDSILFDHIKNSISFALKDYAEKTAEQKAEESKTLGIISVLLFLLIIILVFIMVNAMRLSKKALLDEMSRVQEYGETISELLGSKVTLLRTLSDEYYKLEEEPSWDKPARTKEEIIKSFRTQIGELRTDSSIMEGIEMALDAKYHGLMTSLKESFGPSLKAEEYKILALVLSVVPRPVIRFLTRISDDALRKRISRYREKFKGLPDEQRDLLLEILSPQKVS